MRKYFYMVDYKYVGGDVGLGIFSTKYKAEKKISMSKNLPGFREYGDLFVITKFAVDFDDLQYKTGTILYYIWLEYNDNYEIFDYYSSEEKANQKIDYFKKHTRIGKKFPNLFQISSVVVDDYLSWSEGFN